MPTNRIFMRLLNPTRFERKGQSVSCHTPHILQQQQQHQQQT